MKYRHVEQTYICQLGKPAAYRQLKSFARSSDKSIEEYARFYKFVRDTLLHTPAWGVTGVNKLVNKLSSSIRATANHEKTGKSSAPAQAKKLKSMVDYFANLECEAYYNGRCALEDVLSDAELDALVEKSALQD